jgi:hypothetical protein
MGRRSPAPVATKGAMGRSRFAATSGLVPRTARHYRQIVPRHLGYQPR